MLETAAQVLLYGLIGLVGLTLIGGAILLIALVLMIGKELDT